MDKKLIRSWVLFDWASQPFHTVIVTFIFIPYFVDVFFEKGSTGQIYVAVMAIVSALMVAFLAPIGGAITDAGARRKVWIYVLSAIFVLSLFGLLSTTLITVMIAYIIAYFAVEMLLVFTNAYLPELVPAEDTGRVSGTAWGLGYAGGIVVLAIFLLFLMAVPGSDKTLIGLTPLLGDNAAAYSGPFSAIWYVAFMIPFFLFIPNPKNTKPLDETLAQAKVSFFNTFKTAWRDISLRWFFLSSMIFRDALAGIFLFGSIYGRQVLGWELQTLAAYGIILNIAGIFGGIIGGYYDKKISPFFVVRVSIWAFVVISFAALSTNLNHVVFIPVSEGSILPHAVFFVAGMGIGAFAGSLQGSSRGMVVLAVDGRMGNGEAFGLYGMVGRVTAFIAPTLVLFATWATDSAQYGAWPIVLLFIVSVWAFRKYELIYKAELASAT